MISVRLLFLVAGVLFIADGSKSQPADGQKCAYRGGNFCYLVKAAHNVNQQALNRLNGVLDGEGRRKLAEADKLVMELLTKGKKDLLVLLKKALEEELGALVKVKIDCFTPKSPIDPSKERTCRAAYADVGYAIEELIKAIMEVQTEHSKLIQIQKLREKFYDETFSDPSKNFANEMHALGIAVLGVM